MAQSQPSSAPPPVPVPDPPLAPTAPATTPTATATATATATPAAFAAAAPAAAPAAFAAAAPVAAPAAFAAAAPVAAPVAFAAAAPVAAPVASAAAAPAAAPAATPATAPAAAPAAPPVASPATATAEIPSGSDAPAPLPPPPSRASVPADDDARSALPPAPATTTDSALAAPPTAPPAASMTPTDSPPTHAPVSAPEQSSLTTSASATPAPHLANPAPQSNPAEPHLSPVASSPPLPTPEAKPQTPDPPVSDRNQSSAVPNTSTTVTATSAPASSHPAPPAPSSQSVQPAPSQNSSPSAATKLESDTTTTTTNTTAENSSANRKRSLDSASSLDGSPTKISKLERDCEPVLPTTSASPHTADPRTSSPSPHSAAPPSSVRPAPAHATTPPGPRNRRRHTSPTKQPTADVPAQYERPFPRGLPKTVKHRPENARVFIGNLASEYTDVAQIIKIFHKYGDLIEEPVLRRSFGFVQYSSAEAASRAVAGEQGRIIGGIGIDLSIADNREVKRGTHVANNTPFGQPAPAGKAHARGRVRERDFGSEDRNDKSRKRRRSLSPASAAKKGGVHPPQYRRMRPDPRNGVYLRILCMSPTARSYARQCENTFRSMTGLPADVLHIVAAGLGEALGRAMRDVIPYVMVVASKDVDDGTCTIRTLEKTGYEKSGRGNGVIPLREAVEVCLIERGVIAPQNIAQQMNGAPRGGMGRTGHGGRQGPHGMGSHGRQWNSHSGAHPGNAPVETAKPGWMTGQPRAPHPSNPRAAAGSVAPGIHHQPPHGGVGNVVMPGGAYGYNGVEGNRGHYGSHGPGPHAAPVPPHRPSQGYGLVPAQPQGGYEPGPPVNQGGNMVAPGHQNGGDYMRRSGAPVNPALGMHPPGGYMDRYRGQVNNQNANSYNGRGDNRESEYDPAAVMPAQRGPNPNYENGWNREVAPVNRETYGGDRPPAHQPAVARDRNGGFQTIGGGTQVYPGGSGGAAANNYGYDRSQNQGALGGPYAAMNNTSGYDARQNAYPGAQAAVGYGQYAGPQGENGMPPQSAEGVNRYGGGMYAEGQQQAYTVPGMYNSGTPGPGGRGGGWSGTNSSHAHAMNMHSPPMGGGSNMNQSGMPHGGMGGQIAMQSNAGNQMTGSAGGHAGMNGYGVSQSRANMNGGYIGRDAGGMGSSPPQANANSGVGASAAASVLGQSAKTVDINKLTSLISVFQQKQAAMQTGPQNHMHGQGRHDAERQPMQGYATQQFQGQPNHQRSGGQQGYYR